MTLTKALERLAHLAVRALLIIGLVFGAGAPLGAAPQSAKDKKGEAHSGVKPVKIPLQAGKGSAQAESSGPREGIKVHGHWTIDVRNPDGKLVTHREFENALTQPGANVLAAILSRNASPGEWWIRIDGNPPPCYNQGQGRPFECYSVESSISPQDFYRFSNLKITTTANLSGVIGAATVTVELAGAATAAASSDINQVQALLVLCSGSIAPTSCTQAGGGSSPISITSKILDNPVSVAKGHIFEVSVVISFS